MLDYEVLLSLEATNQLRSIPKANLSSIFAYLNYLQSNPFDEGDFVSIQDPEKREYCIKGIRRYLISYYTDHANKEVKVTSITKNKK
ncbi:MAG: hypothetical protein NE328_16860 [Lentisphaeraceae bacterium]|nr:hypothetical protein [Lentisphaeraceae bacterium]